MWVLTAFAMDCGLCKPSPVFVRTIMRVTILWSSWNCILMSFFSTSTTTSLASSENGGQNRGRSRGQEVKTHLKKECRKNTFFNTSSDPKKKLHRCFFLLLKAFQFWEKARDISKICPEIAGGRTYIVKGISGFYRNWWIVEFTVTPIS